MSDARVTVNERYAPSVESAGQHPGTKPKTIRTKGQTTTFTVARKVTRCDDPNPLSSSLEITHPPRNIRRPKPSMHQQNAEPDHNNREQYRTTKLTQQAPKNTQEESRPAAAKSPKRSQQPRDPSSGLSARRPNAPEPRNNDLPKKDKSSGLSSARRPNAPKPRNNLLTDVMSARPTTDKSAVRTVNTARSATPTKQRRPSIPLARPYSSTPPGNPPGIRRGVSWAKRLLQGGNEPRHSDGASSRHGHEHASTQRKMASLRTDKRITTRDRLDISIIGEFPNPFRTQRSTRTVSKITPSPYYLPDDVCKILPGQLVGPDDFFTPGPEFLHNIKAIMSRKSPPPLPPPFKFSTDPDDLAHNARVIATAGFDFA